MKFNETDAQFEGFYEHNGLGGYEAKGTLRGLRIDKLSNFSLRFNNCVSISFNCSYN